MFSRDSLELVVLAVCEDETGPVSAVSLEGFPSDGIELSGSRYKTQAVLPRPSNNPIPNTSILVRRDRVLSTVNGRVFRLSKEKLYDVKFMDEANSVMPRGEDIIED